MRSRPVRNGRNANCRRNSEKLRRAATQAPKNGPNDKDTGKNPWRTSTAAWAVRCAQISLKKSESYRARNSRICAEHEVEAARWPRKPMTLVA